MTSEYKEKLLYRVAIKTGSCDKDPVKQWCREHCKGDFLVCGYIVVYFEFKEDAVIFKLSWS